MDAKYIKLRIKYDIIITTLFTSTWLLLYFFAIQDSSKPIVLKTCTLLSISMFVATIVKSNIPMKQYIPTTHLFTLFIVFLISILSIVVSSFVGGKLDIYVDNRIKQDPIYAVIPGEIGAADLSKGLWIFPSMYIENVSQVDAVYEAYNFVRGAIGKLNSYEKSEYENYMDEKTDQIQKHDETFFINEIIKKSDINMSYLGMRALTANTLTSVTLTIIGLIWMIEDILLIKKERHTLETIKPH